MPVGGRTSDEPIKDQNNKQTRGGMNHHKLNDNMTCTETDHHPVACSHYAVYGVWYLVPNLIVFRAL